MRILTLTDGGVGMRAQANGLARQMIAVAEENENEKFSAPFESVVRPSSAAALLPPVVAAALGLHGLSRLPSPPPHVVVGCGSRAQAATLEAKRRVGCFVVCVQRPRANAAAFDAVVMPRHDATGAADERSILTLGAVGGVTPAVLASRRERARRRFAAYSPPFVAVLVGGDNRAYRLDATRLVEQLRAVAAAAAATLLITPSRRSGGGVTRALQDAFGGAHFVWDGGGDNPYTDMLAAADGFCVTADSVNMASEACAAGRGVYLLPLPRRGGFSAAAALRKFSRFHVALLREGGARWWAGDWDFYASPPLAETERAAREVLRRFARRARVSAGRGGCA